MKVVVALDSFKGSISSMEAGEAVREGILRAIPHGDVVVLPLADGGEGTVDALISAMNGIRIAVTVTGPLGEPVTACYGRVGEMAVLEMAQAAGLPLVPESLRNPMNTTTRGVGELIAHAISHGCRDFLIGIGGSATNDGGIGMLSALGVAFRDREGSALPGYGRDLANIAQIDTTGLLPELKNCRFRIACDVDNPLCGPNGASAVYGVQKGLTSHGVEFMDKALKAFAELTISMNNKNYVNYKGAGAAGGLGFAFLSYLNGELKSGAELVLDILGFSRWLQGADYFVTGEGRMDSQTAMGKAPAKAAALAKANGVKTIAFVGSVSAEYGRNCGDMTGVFPIQPGPITLVEAMEPRTATKNLSDTAEQVFRILS